MTACNNISDISDRHAFVASWVRSLPEHVAADAGFPPRTSRKRKRQQQQLTSPPVSVEKALGHDGDYQKTMASTPRKRRRTSAADAVTTDPDSTPRPALSGGSVPLFQKSNTGSTPSLLSSSIPSGVSSRASSPRKQMLNLRLRNVVEFNALDLNVLPSAARELVSTITEIGNSLDILPHAVKSSIMEAVDARDPMPRLWRYAFKSPVDDEADARLPGRIPAFWEVEKICRQASECQQDDHEEASWNCTVHERVLELVFQDQNGQQYGDFNIMLCTTARLHPAWKPFWSPGKMIDMCVYYASMPEDAALRDKIARFALLTPTDTVNHTDFIPISTRPLVLSIETKKNGVQWDAAQLQIGTWHAAQWAFLRWAVASKLRRQRMDEEERNGGSVIMSQAQEEEYEATEETKVLSVISDLGFLPGVIVQGHRWYFVCSTYENGKTKLWADRPFGSTQTCLESYSIIAGVRRMAAWARDTYIPWFKLHILDDN
ncbi:hypothetical protein F5Y07DRAFT_404428 [Xylaria sp. FL0933]|nr:hypothetical protein F5Y07DRAFT_404428 [Xylaria sp. FL0933]